MCKAQGLTVDVTANGPVMSSLITTPVELLAINSWGEPERAPPSRLNGCAVYIYQRVGRLSM